MQTNTQDPIDDDPEKIFCFNVGGKRWYSPKKNKNEIQINIEGTTVWEKTSTDFLIPNLESWYLSSFHEYLLCLLSRWDVGQVVKGWSSVTDSSREKFQNFSSIEAGKVSMIS